MNWISVLDSLPEPGQRVIAYSHEDAVHVTMDGKRVRVWCVNFQEAKVSGNNQRPFRWSEAGPGDFFGQDITHWMPIPGDPPEGPTWPRFARESHTIKVTFDALEDITKDQFGWAKIRGPEPEATPNVAEATPDVASQ